jgi:hypothetical protein
MGLFFIAVGILTAIVLGILVWLGMFFVDIEDM